jgi:hypothetical protein
MKIFLLFADPLCAAVRAFAAWARPTSLYAAKFGATYQEEKKRAIIARARVCCAHEHFLTCRFA